MTPDALVRTVEEFLSQAHDAVVLEDGAVAFDLAQAKYSISGERNKCLLHLWSAERNVVRRVLNVEIKNEVLRLAVQRLGQARPTKLEICRERDRRTPTAKRAARLSYLRVLQRVLERRFSRYTVARLTTSVDLERSFGPIYARGLIRQGQSGFAVLGVNGQETQASIAAIDERLDSACQYSQVPAFSASDRAMIDVLTITHERQLAVVELKADE